MPEDEAEPAAGVAGEPPAGRCRRRARPRRNAVGHEEHPAAGAFWQGRPRAQALRRQLRCQLQGTSISEASGLQLGAAEGERQGA